MLRQVERDDSDSCRVAVPHCQTRGLPRAPSDSYTRELQTASARGQAGQRPLGLSHPDDSR